MSEFPKMLYRPGKTITWSGKRFDTRIVSSADEAAQALADGWQHAHDAMADDNAEVREDLDPAIMSESFLLTPARGRGRPRKFG